MKIQSSAFGQDQPIPQIYTCEGESYNPPLEIYDVPAEAKSLALIVEDPDAPGGTFIHWIVWNIRPDTKEIAENSFPEGAAEGLNDSGKAGYIGPCPPRGLHHYYFKLYALDEDLQIDGSSSRQDLERAMIGHILDQAELVGVYEKQQ